MAQELLLEIGTEEIPAAFLPKALSDMEQMMSRGLAEKRIAHGTITTLGTPRRLFIAVADTAERQEDQIIEKMGPAVRVAFDQSGNPSKAAQGFARGQGMEVSGLERIATDKGEYLVARKKIAGEDTASILAAFLPDFIRSIPFQKSMRWMDLDIRFARPIHWIMALFGGAVIPFTVGNVMSGNTSRGHRFMNPGPFEVKDSADYLEKTKAHFVIADPDTRKEIIRKEARKAAYEVSGTVLENEALLDEVAYLIEYPSVVCGTFDREFLDLPREVLITSMMKHQKYFAVVDGKGNLLPHFITVNNTVARNPSVVAEGNQKVLRARLADARFFFEEDRKTPLADRLEDLKNVIFHSLLGTSYEKVSRFRTLAAWIAERIDTSRAELVDRAALLCKADLETQMVYEFTELQGVMGREYARLEGENPEVAAAIYEHYLPVQAGGDLPETETGAIVSIADKMDTIAGCFGVNLIPTGTADPYALRRQALGIINIIQQRSYPLRLDDLVDASLAILKDTLKRPAGEAKRDILEFFKTRFENQLISQGHPYDVVDAVLAVDGADLVRALGKIEAVENFKNHPDFEPLVTAFKRVVNILKNWEGGPVEETLFESDEERNLFGAFNDISRNTRAAADEDRYADALIEMARLRKPVDAFFDTVLVMAEDEKVRTNRMSLLARLRGLFFRIADFSKIVQGNSM
ncbi:MAG: glycine--tRNA ligase subunit beta [Syntrophales bacterium]|nr:glycine--tRNA ligase subunit beta [Syntrophales bacterium]MDY0043939.1 glycine--tRNA ligase subunit beta [Syntrophales bacterium]